MRYRLYMYNSKAATGSALAVKIVNAAVSTLYSPQWKVNEAARTMLPFDTEGIKQQIETELGEKCKVFLQYPPREFDQIGYLCVCTSYTRVYEVLPRLHAIASENGLVLYDAETDRSFFKDLIDASFVTLRIREREIKDCILKSVAPVWSFKKINFYQNERDKSACFSVTINKVSEKSFLERVTDFYNCLANNLREDETLICKDKSFVVSGKWYSLTYVLEGYKKHSDMVGYYENGYARQALIRRMSVYEACKWMDGCNDAEKCDIQERMNLNEMKMKYPNPADRLVRSVRIAKWLQKQPFGIRYGGLGGYGAEIIMHIVPKEIYDEAENVSRLAIEEGSALFILPFIQDIYPYFFERYYLEENHLPKEMWMRIVERVKEVKKQIIKDTYNPDLVRYYEQFDFGVLCGYNDPRICKYDANFNPSELVYEYRYKIANLLEIFIQWSETQLDIYATTGDGRMFNIQGP